MRKTWLNTLLLSFLSFCTCQADTCLVGVFEKSVFLPCHYNGEEDLINLNLSLEWRRGAEVVYKAVWREGHEERDNRNIKGRTALSSLAQTGDFTLELSDLNFSDAQNYSLHLKVLDNGAKRLVCTVCLNIAAHFSPPKLLREGGSESEPTRLVCQSSGGFPEPTVHWSINHSQHPPVEAVTTHLSTLPHSQLYNITSVLNENMSPDTAVSCTIENHLLNETLTTISLSAETSPVRTSAFIWILSITLCVLVTVLVGISLCFQKKWDRQAKREHKDDSDCEETEMIMMGTEYLEGPPNRDKCVM